MVKIAQPRGYADVSLSDRWRSAGEMRPGPTCSALCAACGAFHFTTLPQLRAAKSPAMRARRDRALRRRVRREPCHEHPLGEAARYTNRVFVGCSDMGERRTRIMRSASGFTLFSTFAPANTDRHQSVVRTHRGTVDMVHLHQITSSGSNEYT
jgi:hypothetical protein